MKKKDDEAIAIPTPSGLPAFAQDVDTPESVMKQNLEGRTPRLPQISIMHAGAMSFKFPDGTMAPEFEGVILDTSPARAWWESTFQDSGGGNMPDCFSIDGISPDSRCSTPQYNLCAKCPMNAWGSDPKGGKGKSCKEMARVHTIGKDMALPFRLTLPPSSLRSLDDYMTRLAAKIRHYHSVKTNFKCIEAKNADGIRYTQVEMRDVGDSVSTRDQYLMIKKMAKDMLVPMRGQEIVTEEYGDPAPGAREPWDNDPESATRKP